jgi:DNA helicase-2/ATP-dependent DNA helicase PcrA
MPDKRTQSLALAGHLEDLPETAAHEMSRTIGEELCDAKQGARSDAMVLEILEKTAHPNTLTVETTRQVNGAVFYDDLLRHAQRLLRVPAIASLYRTHYGAVLVDEFQDLSPQQLDIALRTCDASRTFVGDPLQGIYSWTGARPIEVERILRRIGGAPHGLGISYRSSPRVLELLGSVSEQLGGKAMQASEMV